MICEHCGQKIIEENNNEDNKQKIIKACEQYFKIIFSSLITKNRKRENVYQRQIIMTLLSYGTKLTQNQIGNLFNRHRTTVIYAKEIICNLSKVYPAVRYDIENIKLLINTN